MPRYIRIILIVVLVLVMLLGILTAAYPIISNYFSKKYASQVQVEYEQQLDKVEDTKISQILKDAIAYNEALYTGNIHPGENPTKAGYFNVLDPTGTGIMGYVEIPKINVNLPIYHGISNKVLQKGAGHMAQTSLPCGGENTHAAISAHTGLASAPMFTDLVQLDEGDVFYISVLEEKLAYEVDQILTVDPTDVSHIGIEDGQDLVTLITCTPYGVNSHRLLVRGHRIEYVQAPIVQEGGTSKPPQLSAYWQNYLNGIFSGMFAALILAACITIGVLARRQRNLKRKEMTKHASIIDHGYLPVR